MNFTLPNWQNSVKKNSHDSVAQEKFVADVSKNTGTAIRPANRQHTKFIPRMAKKEPANNVAD